MPSQIKDITKLDINQHNLYFVDTNVWIYVLQAAQLHDFEKSYHKKYCDFLEKIITQHIEKKPNSPKIVSNMLLVAEMFNAYMRQVAMYKFFRKKGDNPKHKNFKEDYRGTDDYQRRLKTLIDDFRSYEDYVVFMELNTNIPTFLSNYSENLSSDLNDYYFYTWAKDNKIAIITDDSDYLFDDIPIITANNSLLKK